jgi:thiol-disulfide isomerase/thioredoxin
MNKSTKLTLLFVFSAVIFSLSAQKQANIIIKGKLLNNTYQTVHFDKYLNEPVPLDSVKIVDGSFEIKTNITEMGFYDIRLSNDKIMLLVLNPGDKIELTANVNSFQVPVSFSGSKQSSLVFDLGVNFGSYDIKKDSLNKVYEKIKNTTFKDSMVIILREAFDKFTVKQNELVKDFINKNLNSIGGLLFINRLPMNENMALYIKYDSALYKTYPTNNFVMDFHQEVTKNIRLNVGNVAPDIMEQDTAGKEIALSSLRGKYVLIDFWASWCGPCRRENPHMVKLYETYHRKGFEIYGVSLDKDKNAWKTAIKKDKLIWTEVSDLGFWNAKPAKLYNVNSIPYTVLLDKNGKILAKGLFGAEIEEKLKQIFDSER